MKIAIGINPQEGAFGGGNQFAKLLIAHLRQRGDEVFFDLREPDLDLILMTDPRTSLQSVAFGPIEIIKYAYRINPSVLLAHRINECDERKGTKTLNSQLSAANEIMDHTIFISSWLEQLHRKQNIFTKNSSVIKNGADRSIFSYQRKRLSRDRKIRLVTHHWSANWNKGWDVYSYLDELLAVTPLGNKFELDYIGNVPKYLSLKHIRLHRPQSGKALAKILQTGDIYLTASLNEPAGMHHIEGALCGLPLLYRKSGALSEYCQEYGVGFGGIDEVVPSLELLINKYDHYQECLASYPNTSERMCQEYTDLFDELIARKREILSKRSKKAFTVARRIKLQCLLKALSVFNLIKL